jgi:anti-sigma B factor antagonist
MDRQNSIIGRSLRPRGPVALRLTRRVSADVTVLELGGEVDLLTVSRLAAGLDDEVRHGDRDVVVDLRPVQFIDSSGLHVLLGAQRRLARQGRALGIVCTPGPVLRVFELSRLLDTLDIADSVREFRCRRVSSLARRRAVREPPGDDQRRLKRSKRRCRRARASGPRVLRPMPRSRRPGARRSRLPVPRPRRAVRHGGWPRQSSAA